MMMSHIFNDFGHVARSVQSTSDTLTRSATPLSTALRAARPRTVGSLSNIKTSLAPAFAAAIPATPMPHPTSTTTLSLTKDGHCERNCARKMDEGKTCQPLPVPANLSPCSLTTSCALYVPEATPSTNSCSSLVCTRDCTTISPLFGPSGILKSSQSSLKPSGIAISIAACAAPRTTPGSAATIAAKATRARSESRPAAAAHDGRARPMPWSTAKGLPGSLPMRNQAWPNL
mmetsp:Transcript_122813/g.393420  ORF Transcript_122813/g.393420 Transcript_122813/m.393420 type:complete len:231 (-) Transcript_122813:129-821(-)